MVHLVRREEGGAERTQHLLFVLPYSVAHTRQSRLEIPEHMRQSRPDSGLGLQAKGG